MNPRNGVAPITTAVDPGSVTHHGQGEGPALDRSGNVGVTNPIRTYVGVSDPNVYDHAGCFHGRPP